MKKLFLSLCAGSALTAPVLVNAESVYTIQLGAFKDEKSALQTLDKFNSTTSPAFLRNDPQNISFPYKVSLGRFSTYMDAWAVKNALPSTYPSPTFVDKLSNLELSQQKSVVSDGYVTGVLPFGEVAGSRSRTASLRKEKPNESSFVSIDVSLPNVELTTAVLEKKAQNMTRDELLAVGFNARKNPQGVDALASFLEQYPNASESDAARIRLARRYLARKDFGKVDELLSAVKRTGNQNAKVKAEMLQAYVAAGNKGMRSAYSAFKDIASNPIADAESRVHAMRMAAGYSHALNDMTTAVLAFKQLEDNALTTDDKAEAMLQRCGLMFELAGRQKGSWPEVSESLQALIKSPDIPRNTLATAKLMHLESLYYQNNIQEALLEAQQFVNDFQDIRREWISAKSWEGLLLIKSNNMEQGEAVLREVMALDIKKSEKFGRHEPQARSAYWLAFLALQRNDIAGRDNYINYLKTNFPKARETSESLKLESAVISTEK